MHISQYYCCLLQIKKLCRTVQKERLRQNRKDRMKVYNIYRQRLEAITGLPNQDGSLLPFNFGEHVVSIFILRSNREYECNFKIMGIYA